MPKPILNIGDDPPPEVSESLEEIAPWRVKGSKLLQNVVYNGSLDLANVAFYLYCTAGNKSLNINATYNATITFALLLNAFFFVDMVANFAVYGWSHTYN